ncbi:MAG: hypothetical protein JWQ05_1358 [Methylobacterium sp.]|nr:hypothetical protein [Methylobacterium sp.]
MHRHQRHGAARRMKAAHTHPQRDRDADGDGEGDERIGQQERCRDADEGRDHVAAEDRPGLRQGLAGTAKSRTAEAPIGAIRIGRAVSAPSAARQTSPVARMPMSAPPAARGRSRAQGRGFEDQGSQGDPHRRIALALETGGAPGRIPAAMPQAGRRGQARPPPKEDGAPFGAPWCSACGGHGCPPRRIHLRRRGPGAGARSAAGCSRGRAGPRRCARRAGARPSPPPACPRT